MTRLRDIVTFEASGRGPAVRLDDDLAARAEKLVEAFTPTHSALAILAHLQRAVLPNATKEQRAMIWHGVYGSGKSHLGVLVAHLLREGVRGEALRRFLGRLGNQGHARLSEQIGTTFHPLGDPDARPYLVVTLYGSPAPTLQNALLEGLYRALRDTDGLDPQSIVPKTEFAAALERLAVILAHHPDYRNKPLADWGIRAAEFNAEELEVRLKDHVPDALETFKAWHSRVSAGQRFDPQALGGTGVKEAFIEAADALRRCHGYNGIAVIWDEFGYALENLIGEPGRNPVAEIFDLQDFVESVCAPASGHVLFIALTHRSLREYGTTAKAADDVKGRLATIEGRFAAFAVALKPSETEGYHLLSGLVAPTAQGRALLEQARPRAESLAGVCARMPLFASLAPELPGIVTGCYPLHPIAAAGLFAIAAHASYAQASRTVFTFFQNLESATAGTAFDRPADPQALYRGELIRLPELLHVYRKDIFNECASAADAYRNADAKVSQGFPESAEAKRAILAVLLLARVLGEQFQPTDAFLAAALYDCDTESIALRQELEALRQAGLIWRRDTEVPVWELEAESGIQIDAMIDTELERIPVRTVAGYFAEYPDLRRDLLPQCDVHDFDPSPAGIVRAFEVRVIDDLAAGVRASDERLSALVLFALVGDERQAEQMIVRCAQSEPPSIPTYVWIPKRGVADLGDALREYIAIERLLNQSAAGEGVARRLHNAWDKTRRELRREIKERLGRTGLEREDVAIVRLGDPHERVEAKSWHGFQEYLSARVQALYPQEVHVRTNNANRLYNPSRYKIRGMEDLLRDILRFETQPPDLRNDLFGNNEGSEIAALIDGTLGVYSNGLLIERAEGWCLKTPEETDGAMGELLSSIRDTVLDKRRKVCDIAELRAKLIAPPFGLPDTAIPVFVAVAIRKEVARLKWKKQSGAFESLLWNAFASNSDMELQLDTFKPKQLQALAALHDTLRLSAAASSDPDERARETVSALRRYYIALPEAVRHSGGLSEDARELFQTLKKPGLDAQDVADCLVRLTREAADDEETRVTLGRLFESIEALKDKRASEVRQATARVAGDAEAKARICQALDGQNRAPLAEALRRYSDGGPEDLDRISEAVIRKPLNACTDIEIGRLSNELDRLTDLASRPEPEPRPNPRLVPDPIDPVKHLWGIPVPDMRPVIGDKNVEDEFKQQLSALIDQYCTAIDPVRLRTILEDRMKRLGHPESAVSQ